MNHETIIRTQQLKKKQRIKSRLQKVVMVLACVVVFCTTYALILPAITTPTETFCGVEEHIHTVDCYEQLSRGEPLLICNPQTLGIHVHEPGCWDQEHRLICGQADYVTHTHGDGCYDQLGALRCSLEERTTHVHTDQCYELAVTTATKPAAQGHIHDDNCYTVGEQTLICTTLEAEGHTHEAGCYVAGETLLCTETDSEHSHVIGCYDQVLQCTVEETPGHSHGEDCYTVDKELICVVTEETEATEGTAADAFETPGTMVLICQEVVAQTHSHGDGCFEMPKQTLTCTLAEDGHHIHGELCYGIWDLQCQSEEHTHENICYSDPKADLEYAADWEKSFAEVELRGLWQQDILAVAKTQLGYTESEKNYIVTETGVQKGYTRYGAWYGDPYGDWCAMFVSFCMHYSGVEGIPIHSGCTPWIRELRDMNLFREQGTYRPEAGDIIFFDWENDGLSDHVGLVSEYKEAVDGHPAELITIEGNASNRVRYVSYDPKDVRIAGYGQLSRNRLVHTYCGIDEHTHDAACYNEAEVLLCTLEEHAHDETCNSYKVVYYDNRLRTFAYIEGTDELPQDLSLKVALIDPETDSQVYDSMSIALSEEMASRTQYVGDSAFYSLQLFSQGEPYELPEGATVRVEMSFHQPVFDPEQLENSNGVHTYLITPDPEATEAETEPVTEPETEPEATDVPEGQGELTEHDPEELLEGKATEPTTEPEELTEEGLQSVTEAESAPNKRRPVAIADLEEATEPTEAPEELVPIYQAQPAEDEQILEVDSGITGVNFRTGEIATVALAITRESVTGTFWERLYSLSEIESGGTYMIVSAEGNYALRGNRTTNYQAVTLEAIKANEKYYTISRSDDNLLRWTITKSGNAYIVRNQGASINLRLNNSTFLYNSSTATNSISYLETEKVFRFYSGSYYLRNTGTGAFSRATTTDGTNYSITFAFSRDMLIFKLVDVTLEIPADVLEESGGSGSNGTAPEKPDYPDVIDPSGSKTGATSLTGAIGGVTATIRGEYYSDPATSDIEREYKGDTFAEQELNDGKVLSDKSVIYMGDDYGAFESYDVNTFGVTLSTMGQEYKIEEEEIIKIPIDMVFVLDVSGSMTGDGNGEDADRATTMVHAVNSAIAQIMADHPANRVGVVIYSGGAWELLPLGRYTADDNQYFVNNLKIKPPHPVTGVATKDINFVQGAPSLRSEDGKSYAGVGTDVTQGWGTYTQAGIALGLNEFQDVEDTTYTTKVGYGEYERDYTVIRQPVMVLLSDGEPTYSTNHYMDPENGPHYGDGGGVAQNAKGIHGYYTVLTANYAKRMIGIKYEKPALFYTVGMGIASANDANPDGPAVSTSQTGDNYKRAVLNPTPEIIAALTSNLNASTTTTQFKNLINGGFTSQYVETKSAWPEIWTGVPHKNVPVLQGNPYSDNYSYADGAYFDSEFSEEGLEQVFEDIIHLSKRTSIYGFVLHRNSAIDMSDNIGEGMEIKGDPILRYNGVNYTHTSVRVNGAVTTYVYNYTCTDPYIPNRVCHLSEITVKLTRNPDGTQNIDFYVPDDVLPTYTPETTAFQFYYEALPARLIYQVGLTEESEERILDLQNSGGELTFYTNKWQNEADVAISTLVPSDQNTYYKGHYHEHHDKKEENTTGTRDNAVDCSMYHDTDVERTRVVHTLGNNGKLVFRAEVTEIPVQKKWQGVVADIMNPVTFELYRVTETISEEGIPVINGTFVAEKTLDMNTQWKEVFTGVAVLEEENTYYVIVEPYVTGYQSFYDGTLITFTVGNAPVTGVKVDFAQLETEPVTVTNVPTTELPETGGSGTTIYTLGGCFLIAAACIALMYTKQGKGRKGGEGTFLRY